MNKSGWQLLRKLWRAELLSPKDFVRRAVLIGGVFALARLAGLREFTSILNGTTGSVELSWGLSAVLGVTYIVVYLAFVILVPTLVIAAAISAAWQRLALFRRRKSARVTG
jgi:hypothetical protein